MKQKKLSDNKFFQAGSAVAAVVLFYVILELCGITCPIKYVTGVSCAGCGMSRAWLRLLRLDLAGAFYYHPLFWLPPIALGIFLMRKQIKPIVYKILIFTICTLCVIVYLYRLIGGDTDVVVFEPQNNLLFRLIKYK